MIDYIPFSITSREDFERTTLESSQKLKGREETIRGIRKELCQKHISSLPVDNIEMFAFQKGSDVQLYNYHHSNFSSIKRRHFMAEKNRWKLALPVTLIFILMSYFASSSRKFNFPVDPSSVFVSGAGFSGFWFSIGRLNAMSDIFEKKFYCYSAGCLAVVAALSESNIDELSDICFDVQSRWKQGVTKRHEVVTDFLNHFTQTPHVQRLLNNSHHLSKINVITAVRSGHHGIKSSVRTPTSLEDLYTMLLQTTWIPFATGEKLWHTSADGVQHMDGAFSAHDHPLCTETIKLPWSWKLRLNALNVNLGKDLVEEFWQEGIESGKTV